MKLVVQLFVGWLGLAIILQHQNERSILVAACGGFFCQPQQPVLQAAENIAFGVRLVDGDDGASSAMEVTMAVQINYEGPSEQFAWVLPVLQLPELSIGSELLFRGLFESTKPTYEFTIDNQRSATCSDDTLGEVCEIAFASPVAIADQDDGIEVLAAGTVGPFEFAVIEAKEGSEGDVFTFLNDNGFDQPEESEELITEYAEAGMVFVTLKLQKESESGDITPIVLKYTVPGVDDLTTLPVSCVPLKLTRIAAVEQMPIQIYVLGEARATPSTFFHTVLSDETADWLGCGQSNFFQDDCFLADARARFQNITAQEMVNGRAFMTEFAGPSSSIDGLDTSVQVDATLINSLRSETTVTGFMELLGRANILDLVVAQTIVSRYITVEFAEFSGCSDLSSLNSPSSDQPSFCFDSVTFSPVGNEFDSTGLFEELNTRVFQPAETAQDWIGNFGYITRMLAQLDPDQMDTDPAFIFRPTEPDIPRLHRAVGIPDCSFNTEFQFEEATGLNIYLIDDNGNESTDPMYVEAFSSCGTWVSLNGPPILRPTPLFAFGLSGGTDDSITILPDTETGQYNATKLQLALDLLNKNAQFMMETTTTSDATPSPSPPSSGLEEPTTPDDGSTDSPSMSNQPQSGGFATVGRQSFVVIVLIMFLLQF